MKVAGSGVAMEAFSLDGWDVLEQLTDPVLIRVALWLLMSYVAAFALRFLGDGEFRSARWIGVLAWSYARVGALAVAMALGLLWAVFRSDQAHLFGAVVVIAKIAADHLLWRIENRTANPVS